MRAVTITTLHPRHERRKPVSTGASVDDGRVLRWPRDNYWLYALVASLGCLVWAAAGARWFLVPAIVTLGVAVRELVKPYLKQMS